jgi:hypothetical protein
MALAEALRGDAAKLAYGNSCSKGSLSCKGVNQGRVFNRRIDLHQQQRALIFRQKRQGNGGVAPI